MFVEVGPGNHGVVVVPRERLQRAPVIGFAARVTPTRRSVLAQPATAEVRRPPPVVQTREVIVRRQPPAAPVPFAARESALRAHPGRPLDEATLGTLRRQTPAARAQPLVRPAVSPPAETPPTPVPHPTPEGLPPPRPGP